MDTYQSWLKKWLLSFSALMLLIGGPIIAVNYIVDPLWIFNHSNKWNDVQQGFNERQQKVNKLTFNKEKYDAILLGSSRSTYVNEHDFKGINVFNFAVSSMFVEEYRGYLDYAKELNGGPFDTVFLGLDFFTTNKYRVNTNEPPEYYTDQANSYLYRFKTLASFDTLELTQPILESSLKNQPVFIDHRFYDRNNVAKPFPVTDALRQKRIETNIVEFFQKEEKFQYDPEIAEMLQQLVRENPKTKFVVFTTPVTLPRLVTQLQQPEYWDGYVKWLHDLVGIFGTVTHYMDVNEVTLNEKNFTDSHHFVPGIGTRIANGTWNQPEKERAASDFGKELNPGNLGQEIDLVKKDLVKYEERAFDFLKPLTRQKPILSSNGARSQEFSTLDWKEQLSPLKLLGVKGTFEVKTGNSLLRLHPAAGAETIQFGYPLDVQDREVTMIVSLKGNVSGNGAVQLFLQDEQNGKWERSTYNTIPGPDHHRSFKVTRKIRPGSTSVLAGVRWQSIKSSDEWLEIDKIEVY